jgi:hypothetical protein
MRDITLPWIDLLCMKNADNGFIFKNINKNKNIKERKRSWRPFLIYQPISTANLALFEWNWAGLDVLISWIFFPLLYFNFCLLCPFSARIFHA